MGTLSVRTVQKESGDKIAERDVVGIPLESGCPIFRAKVNSKTKDMVNCRYTLQPTKETIETFFAHLFLQTSSLFTEQSQRYVKSVNPFTRRERSDPL